MQFIDLKTQFERIEADVCKRVDEVLHSQRYIMGPQIAEMEEKLAAYAGTKYAFSCSSGTDALVIPLMAYDLAKDDAVFVPSFTFFASGESVTLAGGTPVFVDSDPESYNIAPEDLERAIEAVLEEGKLNPRGIIAVDLFGRLADYGAIKAIAEKHDLFVLEDAAQGFGASRAGKRAGSFGNVAATSFFPAKPLGCYGDGGAIFTDDDDLAQMIRSIRVHGQGSDKYDNVRIGVNGRMDTIQAAVILSKLQIFDDEIVARNRVAAAYTERLFRRAAHPFGARRRGFGMGAVHGSGGGPRAARQDHGGVEGPRHPHGMLLPHSHASFHGICILWLPEGRLARVRSGRRTCVQPADASLFVRGGNRRYLRQAQGGAIAGNAKASRCARDAFLKADL